jgi:hypothetical protein
MAVTDHDAERTIQLLMKDATVVIARLGELQG